MVAASFGLAGCYETTEGELELEVEAESMWRADGSLVVAGTIELEITTSGGRSSVALDEVTIRSLDSGVELERIVSFAPLDWPASVSDNGPALRRVGFIAHGQRPWGIECGETASYEVKVGLIDSLDSVSTIVVVDAVNECEGDEPAEAEQVPSEEEGAQ